MVRLHCFSHVYIQEDEDIRDGTREKKNPTLQCGRYVVNDNVSLVRLTGVQEALSGYKIISLVIW